MRFVFAGTPDFAATILRELLQNNRVPEFVMTQPDRGSGRGRKVLPSPVKQLATAAGIEVLQPTTLKQSAPESHEIRARFAATQLDVLVVAAYGLILPRLFLAHPQLGAINVHASLLPRWRGAAPVERAIMANDAQTGVTLMQMDSGLDTGDVIDLHPLTIGAEETGSELTSRLAQAGAQRLVELWAQLATLPRTPQPEDGVTYADKLTTADGLIDWRKPAVDIHNQVRALTGRSAAYCLVPSKGELLRIKVLRSQPVRQVPRSSSPGEVLSLDKRAAVICCGAQSAIELLQLQLPGKGKAIDIAGLRNGYPDMLQPGSELPLPDEK